MAQDNSAFILAAIENISSQQQRIDEKVDSINERLHSCATKSDLDDITKEISDHKKEVARWKSYATGALAAIVFGFSFIKNVPHEVFMGIKAVAGSKH
jgi:hypothetical protein